MSVHAYREEIQRIKAANPDIPHREAFSMAAKNVWLPLLLFSFSNIISPLHNICMYPNFEHACMPQWAKCDPRTTVVHAAAADNTAAAVRPPSLKHVNQQLRSLVLVSVIFVFGFLMNFQVVQETGSDGFAADGFNLFREMEERN